MMELPLPAIAICVPVRNEEELLPGLLRACGALDLTGTSVALCLYFDGCTDRSRSLVEERAARLPLPVVCRSGDRHAEANAGRARAAAMALGLELLDDDAGLLLSTDADSQPEPDWVQAALAALSLADIAAGRVVRSDGAADLNQTRVERYYDRLHAHRRATDPVAWEIGGCHFGGGANMAIRASTYRSLGGFLPMPSGEDALLLDDAARAGWRVRHDPAMRVHTSSRRTGRAPGGLATALNDIDANGLPLVEHPMAADWQYRMQALARQTFATIGDRETRERLGHAIGSNGDHVLGVARDCPNAEAFCMRVVPAAPDAGVRVQLADAEDALTRIEAARCVLAA